MTDPLSNNNYGLYLDFPDVGHLIRRVEHQYSDTVFRKKIGQALIKINEFEDSINTSSAGTGQNISVNRTIDIGIANGLEFFFLDENESVQLNKGITKKELKFLDLVIFIHYRYPSTSSKRVASLRFDQFFLRIGFKGPVFTFFHAKGLLRTTPQELMQLILDAVHS